MKKASLPPAATAAANKGRSDDNGKTEDTAGAAPSSRGSRLSPALIFGIVFVLLVAIAGGLIAFHPTARARASGLAEAVLSRVGTGGDGGASQGKPGPAPTEKETLAAERAVLEAERARLEALKADLTGREATLARREEAIVAGEQALQDQLNRQAALASDLNRLVRICQQMRPREAAELMEQLDNGQALAILLRLGEASAAQILGAMSRERAAQLIKLLVPVSTG